MQSVETLLIAQRGSFHNWSRVWAGGVAAGGAAQAAAGDGGCARQPESGRWRLRVAGALLGSSLTLHCRVAAAFLGGGGFKFALMLCVAVAALASPLRHFELFVGQWSLSGPGRAFRYTPLLDGIGAAMGVVCVLRAVVYCCSAAAAAVYMWHALSDNTLPFSYCRDDSGAQSEQYYSEELQTVVCEQNATHLDSPANEFFFKKVMGEDEGKWPVLLLMFVVACWLILWALMQFQQWRDSKLVWNMAPWWQLVVVAAWAPVLLAIGVSHVTAQQMRKFLYTFDSDEDLVAASDALEISLHIHAAAAGSEIILGKGLNLYASGHIDPELNGENVQHSVAVTALALVHAAGALTCAAAVDAVPHLLQHSYQHSASSLWVLPLYSKCLSIGTYKHFFTALIFMGMAAGYLTVAYMFLKTTLHCMFEYNIKLLAHHRWTVSSLIFLGLGLSAVLIVWGGVRTLEAVEQACGGLAVPLLGLLETLAMLWVYGDTDFVSDMRVATEDNCSSTRIDFIWRLLPFLLAASLVLKCVVVGRSRGTLGHSLLAAAVLALVLAVVAARAARNTLRYLRDARLIA